jgi:hypothetical protein
VAESPSGMDRPPYKDEGILGPGGRKFIAWVVALAVVVGLGVVALNVDFGEIADEIEELGQTTTNDEPTGGDRSDGGSGSSGGDEASSNKPPPPLSTGGLAHALDALREEVGPNPDLLRVLAAPDGIELDVRSGNEPVGYRWIDGELTKLQFVVVVGPQDGEFPASQVDPASLGRLLEGAKRHDRGRNLEVVNAILAPDLIESKLQWVLNEEAPNGANLTFKARPSGRAIQQIGGTGAPGTGLPPQTQRELRDAQRGSECIENAGGESSAITQCMEQFPP